MALDIAIKVDPGNSVQAVKAVTDALHKAEDQGAKVGPAASAGIDKLTKSLEKSTKAGVNWGAKFAEMRTGMMMGMASQLMGNANAQVAALSGALNDVGIKVGGLGQQIGFQFGLLGAVAGVTIETLGTGLGGVLDDIFNKDLRNSRAASEAYIERMRDLQELIELEEEYEEQARRARQEADDLDPTIGGVNRALDEHLGAWQRARDAVISYTLALTQVKENRGAGFVDRQEIELERSLRDARIALTGVTAKYGSVAADARIRTLRNRDAIADARAAFADGAMSAKEYADTLRSLGVRVEDTADKMRRLAEERARLSSQVAKDLTDDLVRRLESEPGTLQELGIGQGIASYSDIPAAPSSASIKARTEAANLAEYEAEMLERIQGPAKKHAQDLAALEALYARGAITTAQYTTELEKLKEAAGATSELDRALQALNDGAMQSLVGSAQAFGDALVDSIFDAKFEWSNFVEQLARDMLKQSTRQLISFGIAALGGGANGFDAMVPAGRGPFLPGFATGGDFAVGGQGGTDSKIAMFRVTPGETVHVRTPEQRTAAERAAGGGGQRTVNVFVPGDRGVVSEQNIEGMVVRVIERNARTVGSRLR